MKYPPTMSLRFVGTRLPSGLAAPTCPCCPFVGALALPPVLLVFGAPSRRLALPREGLALPVRLPGERHGTTGVLYLRGIARLVRYGLAQPRTGPIRAVPLPVAALRLPLSAWLARRRITVRAHRGVLQGICDVLLRAHLRAGLLHLPGKIAQGLRL